MSLHAAQAAKEASSSTGRPGVAPKPSASTKRTVTIKEGDDSKAPVTPQGSVIFTPRDDDLVRKLKTRVADSSYRTGGQFEGAEESTSQATWPVDERAWMADWYHGTVPGEELTASLQGQLGGSFAIRTDKANNMKLYLHYRHRGDTLVQSINASPEGIHVGDSELFFQCLSDLVFHYSAPWPPENKELPCSLRLAGRTEMAKLQQGPRVVPVEERTVEPEQPAPAPTRPQRGPSAARGDPWLAQDVCNWLDRIGLGQFEEAFFDKGIDGKALLSLEETDLARLGITEPQHKSVFLTEQKALSARVTVGKGMHAGKLRRRTFAVKEVKGQVKIFDMETGEEIHEITAEIMRVMGAFGIAAPAPERSGGEFAWGGHESGWIRRVEADVVVSSKWSTTDLAEWLAFVKLDECVYAIRTAGLTGARFGSMTAQELRQFGEANQQDAKMLVAGELFHMRAMDSTFGKNDHLTAKWYHPKLSKADARSLLMYEPSGAFVVWDVNGGRDGYGLTYNFNGSVFDTYIEKANGCLALRDSKMAFSTLMGLVSHYGHSAGVDLRTALTIAAPSSHAPRSCVSRIDSRAREANWFKCGFPADEIMAQLRATGQQGDFVVRDSDVEDSLMLTLIGPEGFADRLIRNDPIRGLHLDGSGIYCSTLSELIYTFASANVEQPHMLVLTRTRDDHLSAPWFRRNEPRESVAKQLLVEVDGAFAVRQPVATVTSFELHYVFQGIVMDAPIREQGGELRIASSTLSFTSLSGLINHYAIVPSPDLPCLLRFTHADMTAFPTAKSRVDPAAMASVYYIGTVPHEVALDLLEGAFNGAFAIRDDVDDKQVLWLHHVADGDVKDKKIVNTPQGLQMEGSTVFFETLSDLCGWYCGENDEFPYTLRMGWARVLPDRAPLIGENDHLSAPWFKPRTTMTDAVGFLSSQPSGSFIVSDKAKEAGHFTLFYTHKGKVLEVDIHPTKEGGFSLAGSTESCFSVAAVIAHCYVLEDGLQCKLVKPIAAHIPYRKPGSPPTARSGGSKRPVWMKLGISKDAAIELIRGKPDGVFVIRTSESRANCFGLSYCFRGLIHNELIVSISASGRRGAGFVMDKAPTRVFPDLEHLVEYYSHPRPELGCPLRVIEEMSTDVTRSKQASRAFNTFGGSEQSAERQRVPRSLRSTALHEPQAEASRSDIAMTGVHRGVVTDTHRVDCSWWQLGVPKKISLAQITEADGSFVVRDSERTPNCYVLSYMYKHRICHEKIRKTGADSVHLNCAPTRVFKNLHQLVAYYLSPSEDLPVPLILAGAGPAASRPESRGPSRQSSFIRRAASVKHPHAVEMGADSETATPTSTLSRSTSVKESGLSRAGSERKIDRARPGSLRQRMSALLGGAKVAMPGDPALRGSEQCKWVRLDLNKDAAMDALETAMDGDFYIHGANDAWAELSMAVGPQFYSRKIDSTRKGLCLRGASVCKPTLAELLEHYQQADQIDLPVPLVC